jgi:ABC-type sugar transport system, ATPase component
MGEILRIDGISKSFPGVQALSKIKASFNKGEINALVGENGAGKSTLVFILMGAMKPDEGKLFIEGSEVNITGVHKAKEYGIGAVFQEPSLINYMSVGENIFLGEQGMFKYRGILSYSKIFRAAEKILNDLKIEIDVRQLAISLDPAQRKLIELAKMIRYDPKIIILDEITAVLDYDSVIKMFEIIRKKRDEGKTVIFISHRLKEVFDIAETAVVLKEGRVVEKLDLKDTTEEGLINLMMGRKLSEVFPKRISVGGKEKEVIFSVSNLSVKGKLENINLDINKGEIVALAGLRGHGQSELLRAIFGLVPKSSGKIFINSKEVLVNNPVKAKMEKIAFLSNKREDELCFTHSIRRNIALSSLGKRQRAGFIIQSNEKKEVSDISSKMNIIAPSLATEVGNLSGGNKQKVVFCKWLLTQPDLLLCDEPAEGLDVGAKSEVYHILRRLADEGKSILLVLSDMVEILNLPDRVVVIREGKIIKEFGNIGSENREMLEKKILKASVGVI